MIGNSYAYISTQRLRGDNCKEKNREIPGQLQRTECRMHQGLRQKLQMQNWQISLSYQQLPQILPTVSLQRCAEKGKLAPPGVWEVVTTTNSVNVLTALWIIKWLSLKSKLFFINFEQIGEILFPSRHIFIKYIVMESYLNLKTGEIKSNSTYKCKWSLFI